MAIKLSNGRAGSVFEALGDATRRGILARLRGGSRPAGALAADAAVTKATLSHHLRVLLAADLVRCERRGRNRIYSINTSVFEDVGAALADLLAAPATRRSAWKRIVRAS